MTREGAGKTLTAIKTALLLKQRIKEEKGYNPKILYVLPYTSIIEQNYDVFSKVIGKCDNRTLMKHHHLSERNYKHNEHEEYGGDIPEHLIESWDSEIVVSTFVQLLHSIFTNKNSQLKKFHNIASSIIILDEVQSIPYKYWILVKQIFMNMAKYLNTYFILMTATMPLIFSEQAGEILELASSKNKYFESFNRIEIDTSLLDTSMSLDEFLVLLHEDIEQHNEKSFLIVVNTIRSSTDIYDYVKNNFKDKAELYYLSTNIIPLERSNRIKGIKESGARKIIVATQMVEAGVDIDIDRVYRDLGPMDSINQVAGRCNREWGKDKGKVILIKLVDEANNNKEYSSYVYGSDIIMKATKKILENVDKIEEADIFRFSDMYFNELKIHGSDEQGIKLLEMIEKLDYTSAFEFTNNKDTNENVFCLIKSEFKTIDVFIEIDSKAKAVWANYEEIRKIEDNFVRKRSFNNIKKDFSQYIISVPEAAVKKHMNINENEYIIKISMEMLDNTYDKATGFMRYNIPDYFA